MPRRTTASHPILIAAPIAPCHRFFSPAGEEIWAQGWSPNYIYPDSGQTQIGMVFTTGQGNELTIWNLVDYDIDGYYSRYSRVTPALWSGTVEVQCVPVHEQLTKVNVSYQLTALSARGAAELADFEGRAYADMIESWKQAIDQHLPQLLSAAIP